MKIKLKHSLIAALMLSGSAFALSADQALSDSQNEVVLDNFGSCVMTNDGIDGCGQAAPQDRDLSLKADAFFDTGKYSLKPAGKAQLDQVAQELKDAKRIDSIELVGHTDSVGKPASNQLLSERRAQAVKDYLVSKGVNRDSIITSGQGQTNPIASNKTKEGRAQNRRVDIKIKAKVKKSPSF